MIHFKPSAFFRSRPATEAETVCAAPTTLAVAPVGRGEHARMLAYAAKRRQAAASGVSGGDVDYWKACAPFAIAKAASIRTQSGFAPLP